MRTPSFKSAFFIVFLIALTIAVKFGFSLVHRLDNLASSVKSGESGPQTLESRLDEIE
jgi:hypothetical protein